MSAEDLVETALGVLVAWTERRKPVSADVDILQTAFPAYADLPVDELACQVIHDLSGRTLRESGRVDVDKADNSRVA